MVNTKEKPPISERRKFFTNIAHNAGLGVMGGLLWGGYTDKAKSSPLTLRPPGALDEEDFLFACIKCGLCAEACVNRPSNISKETGKPRPYTLQMAKAKDDVTIGTPFFKPLDVPCYMCEDIPSFIVSSVSGLAAFEIISPYDLKSWSNLWFWCGSWIACSNLSF